MKLKMVFILMILSIIFLAQESLKAGLSKESRLDILVSQLRQASQAGDYPKVLLIINKLKAIDKNLGVEIIYFEAKALAETGKETEAFEMASKYIERAGYRGANYDAAITLYGKYEEKVERIYAAKRLKAAMDASVVLGEKYMLGTAGKQQDGNLAIKSLIGPARKSHPHAMYLLGKLLINNDYDVINRANGLVWYESFLALGNNVNLKNRALAAYSVALIYFNGKHVETNYVKAMNYFEIAVVEDGISSSSRATAHYALGLINYMGGKFGRTNYKKALNHFNQAIKASTKYADPIWRLGDMYERGWGVKTDLNKAREYYNQGVALGHDKSIEYLAKLNKYHSLENVNAAKAFDDM